MADVTKTVAELPWSDIGASIMMISVILLVRWAVVRSIRGNSETLNADRRKWISVVRNLTVVLIFIGLLLVWSIELSKFALSIAAFAVAIVIASKEVIICLTGGLYRTMTRPFETGDWIEVGDVRGEVLQEGLMSTVLHELSPAGDQTHDYTGHIITVPNGMILTHNIINLNIRKQFVFHTFNITINALDSLQPKEDLSFLCDEIEAEWIAYDEDATKYWTTVRRDMALDMRKPDPLVRMRTTDLAHIVFDIRLLCPREQAVFIEQRVTTRFLMRIQSVSIQRMRRKRTRVKRRVAFSDRCISGWSRPGSRLPASVG